MPSHADWPGAAAAALVAAFLVLCTGYLQIDGIRTAGDTQRYASGAERLMSGLPLEGKQRAYPGYSTAVAASEALGFGWRGLIGLQILMALAAAYCLHRLGGALGPRPVGLLAAGAFLLNPAFIRWHTYVLTDSLYISVVVITTYAIHRAALEPTGRSAAFAYLAMAAAVSLRPNGWVLVPVAVGFWLFLAPAPAGRRRKALLVLPVVLLVPFAPGLRASVAEEDPGRMLRSGVVIWGYAPANLEMPPDEGATSGLWNDLGYARRHPVASLRLASARVGTELLHARPFYSVLHNAAVLAWLLPIYLLAAVSLVVKRRDPLVRLIVLVVGGHLMVVAVTFADWDGRFLLHTLPVIQLLAASSLVGLVRVVRGRIEHPSAARP